MTNDTQALLEGSWIERTYAASLSMPILDRIKQARTSPMIYERDGWGARTCNLVADAQAEIEALSSSLAAAERERDAMAEALRKIEAFDDGEQMADDVWDELMDIARAALAAKQEPTA